MNWFFCDKYSDGVDSLICNYFGFFVFILGI